MTSLESSNVAKLVLACFSLIMIAQGASSEKIYLEGTTLGANKDNLNSFSTSNTFSTRSESYEYMVMQYREPSKQQYRDWMEENGVELISYVPEDSWLVKTNTSKEWITSQKKVERVIPYRSKYRIDSSLKDKADKSTGPLNVRIKLFKSAKKPREILKEHTNSYYRIRSGVWKVEIKPQNMYELSEKSGINYIYPETPEIETKNDDSRALIGANKVQESPYNLRGEGFTAAIWDGGSVKFHPDLNYSGKTILGEDNGVSAHAVHVAGTMLGGGKVNDQYRGIAPDSKLVSYDFFFSNGQELLNETNKSVSIYNAAVSQNSWGLDPSKEPRSKFGDYLDFSTIYDEIVNGNKRKLSSNVPVVFSAGNSGPLYSGLLYNTTTGPGATAKNTITVGAVDENRDVAGYSSRGPTDDGRIKPTLVALGGSSVSTGDVNSSVSSTKSGYPYSGKRGTSMASPAVSGATILVTQEFNRTYDRLPEPATVKGSLIQTATDLNKAGPDYITGWGLVNATEAINYISTSGRKSLIQRGNLSSVGDSKSYKVSAPESTDLRFTLVWSDYPAKHPAGKTLVNDLDLIVKNSTGHRKYPYTLSYENRTEPAKQNSKDSKNVVEQVEIANTDSQTFNITINASNSIKGGKQDYSLLLSKDSSLGPGLEIQSPENISYRTTPDFNLTSVREIGPAKFSVDGGENFSMAKQNSTLFYNITTTLDEGRHDVEFWANNSERYWNTEEVQFTVDKTNPSLNVTQPTQNANISGNFTLNATASDTISDSLQKVYEIKNQTFSKEGSFNDTLKSSELEDGNYNISFNVTDAAGNFNNSTINVTVDNTKPVISSITVQEDDIIGSDFNVNATVSDTTSGVSSSEYAIRNSTLERSGELNSTADISGLENGSYNISYIIKDYSGNLRNRTIKAIIDSENPSLEVLKPSNNSFVKSNFSVKALTSDTVTDINSSTYNISNTTTQSFGSLNNTVNTSDLSEGMYNITFRANDSAGNVNTTRINVSLDKFKPEINFVSPVDGENISGNFSVNASGSDSFSGVESIGYSVSNNSVQRTGSSNSTINSSLLEDGPYNVSINITDRAGNKATDIHKILIDNSPPVLENSNVNNKDNISRTQEVRAEFADISSISVARFRFRNSSGNQTQWEQINSSLDTEALEDGKYNISIQANYTLGNLRETKILNVTVDNTNPQLSLEVYSTNAEYKGWINNSQNVEVSCTDSPTGPANISTNDKSNTTIPGNLTVTESGNFTRNILCTDYAGNTGSQEIRLAIDSKEPILSNTIPSNNTQDISRNPTIDLEVENEQEGSGINPSESTISINKGSISVEWSESSAQIDISNLEYSENVEITGTIVDNLGHKESILLDYKVEDEPQQETNNGDSSDSGGGGGGGGALPETSSSQEENNTQAEKDDGEQREPKAVLDIESELSKNPTIDPKSVESGSEADPISISVSEAEENIEPPENASKVSLFDMEPNTSETEDVNLTFGVNKSSIDRKDLNTTALYRREDGKWKELETTYLREEESEYIFKSQITGFSPFMVAIKQSRQETTVNNTENVSENEEIQRTDSTQSFNLRILAIATITVLVVALLALRRRRTKKLSPDISKHKNQADKLKNGEGTQ